MTTIPISDSIFKAFVPSKVYAILRHSTIISDFFRPLLAEKLPSEEVQSKLQKMQKSINDAITKHQYIPEPDFQISNYMKIYPHHYRPINRNEEENAPSLSFEIDPNECSRIFGGLYYWQELSKYIKYLIKNIFAYVLSVHIIPLYSTPEEYENKLNQVLDDEISGYLILSGLKAQCIIDIEYQDLYNYLKTVTINNSTATVVKPTKIPVKKVGKYARQVSLLNYMERASDSFKIKNSQYSWFKKINPYKQIITLEADTTLSADYEFDHSFSIRFFANEKGKTVMSIKCMGVGARSESILTDILSADDHKRNISPVPLCSYLYEIQCIYPLSDIFIRLLKYRLLPALETVILPQESARRNVLNNFLMKTSKAREKKLRAKAQGKKYKVEVTNKSDLIRCFIMVEVILANPEMKKDILRGLKSVYKTKINAILNELNAIPNVDCYKIIYDAVNATYDYSKYKEEMECFQF